MKGTIYINFSGITNNQYHGLNLDVPGGGPAIVNISFNVLCKPIVNTLEDAFHCPMGTTIELLKVDNCILSKEDQNLALLKDYKNAQELD